MFLYYFSVSQCGGDVVVHLVDVCSVHMGAFLTIKILSLGVTSLLIQFVHMLLLENVFYDYS